MERESAYINLGNNHNAIVDLEDLPKLSLIRWFAEKRYSTYYAVRTQQKDGVRKKLYMHHYVMGEPLAGREIDHINGNGLDNRKENLRFCSHRQNLQARRKRKKMQPPNTKALDGIKPIKSGLSESATAMV